MSRTAEQNLARTRGYVRSNEWRRIRARDNASRKNNPNRSIWYRRSDLKRYYGITIQEWEEMFLKQGRRCAACGSYDPGNKGGQWATDHDHRQTTRPWRVRGILCQGCNKALGHVKDDPDRLRMLVAYLETARCKHGR